MCSARISAGAVVKQELELDEVNDMEVSYVNRPEGRKEFLEAVDTVCINCHYGNDEVCETCPVRKTCDELPEVQK